MNHRFIASLATALGCAASASASITVVNVGLQSGMSVPSGVTLNNIITSSTGNAMPSNLALSTVDGASSGLSLSGTASGDGNGWVIGTGGSFAPIGSNTYDNNSAIINSWVTSYQSAYGTIWQGGANALNGNQTMTLTLSGLTANTDYTISLLSARGNTFTAIQNPGTIGFAYNGGTAGVTTLAQGTGTLADTTLSMTTSAGSASGLNAREMNWSFNTGETPGNAVITLTGAWNLNAVIVEAVPEPSAALLCGLAGIVFLSQRRRRQY